jgi:UDP-N-acetylglucosamine pyrophosphorylase
LLLREVAQCAPEDLDAFQDTDRYRYFNTNNIWLRLDALRETLDAHGGVLPLPVIRNRKTVDPRDKGSTPVIQLEAAMGAAIECFDASRAIEVGRERFAPVKTSADLLAVRSDAYRLADDGRLELAPGRQGVPPVVELDARFRMVDALDGLGLPSLLGCRRLSVEGAVEFGPCVVIEGGVSVKGDGVLGAGVYRDCEIDL